MNSILKLLLSTILIFNVCKGYSSDSTAVQSLKGIGGIYKAGKETLYINSKNGFYLMRAMPKLQDVAIPLCYDTIAKGIFQKISNNVFKLTNDKAFQRVYFSYNQKKAFSEDTIYVQILLPKDDAFIPGRFNYLLRFGCSGSFNSNENLIKIPKNKIFDCEHNSLGLVIQDLNPYCNEEQKCYQRIYFRIFDLLSINHSSNFFTVVLHNFNECYVERMDVENDIIYFDDKNCLQWRGKEFKKVDSSSLAQE